MSGDVGHAVLSSDGAIPFPAAPWPAICLDGSGRILACNPAALQSYGPTDETSPGQPADGLAGTWFADLTGEGQDRIERRLHQGAVTGLFQAKMRSPQGTSDVHSFDVAVLDRTGTSITRVLLLRRRKDPKPVTRGSLGRQNAALRQDLSDMRDERDNLQASQLSMQTFAHAASHDLRTPLNTIMGLLELFTKNYGGDLPDRAQDYLHHLSGAADQMYELATHLLDHAVSSSHPLEFEQVHVRLLLELTIEDLQGELEAAGSEVVVEGEGFSVLAEPVIFKLLLTNLLTNAMRYRRDDRPSRITIELVGDGLGGAQLHIRDNGIGFSAEKATEIFKPFYRAKGDGRGSGLGLSTCAEVCRRHGWRISARSKPGEGACFTVDFNVALRPGDPRSGADSAP